MSTDVERFAQSDAGKLSMVLIAWKIAGKDAVDVTFRIIRMMVTIGILIIVTLAWIYFFKRTIFPIESVVRTGLFSSTVKYREYDGDKSDMVGWALLYAIVLVILLVTAFLP